MVKMLWLHGPPPYWDLKIWEKNAAENNFCGKKILGGQHFRHQLEISVFFPTKIFHRLLYFGCDSEKRKKIEELRVPKHAQSHPGHDTILNADKRRTKEGHKLAYYLGGTRLTLTGINEAPGAGRSRHGGHASEVTVTTWRQKKRLLFHQGTCAYTLLMYYIFPSILRWQNSCRTSIFTCFHLMKIFREGWISQGIISLLMGVGN